MLALCGHKRESPSIFCTRRSRLNYGRFLGGATVFDGNLKVAAVGGEFGKINTYKKVAKSVLLVKEFTEFGGEGK